MEHDKSKCKKGGANCKKNETGRAKWRLKKVAKRAGRGQRRSYKTVSINIFKR